MFMRRKCGVIVIFLKGGMFFNKNDNIHKIKIRTRRFKENLSILKKIKNGFIGETNRKTFIV